MAEKSIADSHDHLPIDAPHQPTLKDTRGSDNSLTLLPQWLHAKSGDNKEYHASPHHSEPANSLKGPGIGESSCEVEKREDIHKLILHDSETGYRDCWRDEERETKSAIHRDHRWERSLDNSMRQGECRKSLERWNDSGNRESSQRRESRWNTHWGPDDKESESSKDSEGPQEKIVSRFTGHGRDTYKDGEMHSRSWRPNSFMARGKVQPSYQHSLTPHKQIHIPGYGRGSGENGPPLSPSGHGNFNSNYATTPTSRPCSFGALSTKTNLPTGSTLLRYSRIKLLDIYRTTDLRSQRACVDGFIEIPFLIQPELLEPFALLAPTIEELVILKAIEKGEVASNGEPPKDGNVGRNTVDPVITKQMKLGIHEDLQYTRGDYKIEGSGSMPIFDGRNLKVEPGNAAPWRSKSEDIHSSSPYLKDNPAVFGARSSEVSWSHLLEDAESETCSASVSSSFYKDGSNWQNNQFHHIENRNNPKRYASDSIFLAQEDPLSSKVNPATRKFEPNPPSEVPSLCYRDPHGHIQGPFSESDLIGWFEAGYFGIDLEVRRSDAPPNTPFLLLGDVLPQLRPKFRSPPGFCAANPSDIQDMSDREKSRSTAFCTHSGIGFESSKSMQRSGVLVSTEADNRVLESLMTTNLRSSTVESLGEGMHSREHVLGPGFSPSHFGEDENGLNYLLAQKSLLEQRRNSLPNSLQFLPGRDSPVTLSPGIISNSSESYSKCIPLTSDPAYQASQALQQLDLLSLLHAAQADKSTSETISSGAVTLSNLPVTQALCNNQNQQLTSQFGFAVQQQNQQQLQPQNLPSLSQFVDHPAKLSGIVSSEQLRSLDITQDTQMLNMLAQHYLLSQPTMEPQGSLASQFSLFNECLLLKQQLQQQQQQQQQLLLQQQQLLLSQVLSGHQSSLNLGEPSEKLCSTVPEGIVPTEHLLPQAQKAYINQKMLAGNLHDGHNSITQTVNLHDRKNVNSSLSCSGPSLHLPHQIIASSSKKPESDQDVGDSCLSEVSLPSGIPDTSLMSDAFEKPDENFAYSENEVSLKCYAKEARTLMPMFGECVASEYPELSKKVSCTSGLASPIADQIHDLKISSDDNDVEQHYTDVSAVKYSKTLEICQTKKSTEKKARKKKNAKSQLALELLSGFSITNQPEQPKSKFESEDAKSHVLSDAKMDILKPPHEFVSPAVDDSYNISPWITADSQKLFLPPLGNNNDKEARSSNRKSECIDSGISELSRPWAWKSAPGIKAKSLKEIQLEEQQRVQMETVGGFDHNSKHGRDSVQVDGNTEYILNPDGNFNSKSRKSHLHDLSAKEVLAKSSGADANISRDAKEQVLPPVLSTVTFGDLLAIEEDFVEAKDIKKGRKKASKSKVTEDKNTSPVGSFDLFSQVVVEMRTSQSLSQNENDVLPSPLSISSQANFISWKGEQSNSSQESAWPIDVGKLHKPTSLRDIQKEEENKASTKQNILISSPPKVQPTQVNRGTGSWQVPQSSPSSGTSPLQSSSSALVSRLLKSKIDDDLFWGPIDQSNQQVEQSNFPSVGANPTSAFTLSASRAKEEDEPSSFSEAMGFREWCEEQLVRLTGTNDTSLLEYCSKQATAETETLLKENLGSLDRNHEFIDKFLSYKEMLSPKVMEMAFRANSSRPAPGSGDAGAAASADVEAGKGAKKRGKKGKKKIYVHDGAVQGL